MIKRRVYTRNFKLSVINQLRTKKMAEVCREHDLHKVMVHKWKKEFKKNPEKAFSGCGHICRTEAELERYKRIVGELYAEIDLLKKTTEKLQKLQAEEEVRNSR